MAFEALGWRTIIFSDRIWRDWVSRWKEDPVLRHLLKKKEMARVESRRYVSEFVEREMTFRSFFFFNFFSRRTKVVGKLWSILGRWWSVHSWPERRLSVKFARGARVIFDATPQKINAYRSSNDERKKKGEKLSSKLATTTPFNWCILQT